MNADFPQLTIERLPSGLIRLTNTDCGDSYLIEVHPVQVQYMAEQLGIVRKLSATESDTLRTQLDLTSRLRADLQRLAAWLELLEVRASQLHDNILATSQLGHEDLCIEVAQSASLADIVEQVMKDAQASLTLHDIQPAAVTPVSREVRDATMTADDLGKPAITAPAQKADAKQMELMA